MEFLRPIITKLAFISRQWLRSRVAGGQSQPSATKWGLLWSDLAMGASTGVKSGSRQVPAMARHLSSTAADVPVKFQGDAII